MTVWKPKCVSRSEEEEEEEEEGLEEAVVVVASLLWFGVAVAAAAAVVDLEKDREDGIILPGALHWDADRRHRVIFRGVAVAIVYDVCVCV